MGFYLQKYDLILNNPRKLYEKWLMVSVPADGWDVNDNVNVNWF